VRSLRSTLRSNRAAFLPATAGSLALHVFGIVSFFSAPSCSHRERIVSDAIEVSMVALPRSQRNVPDRLARAPRATGSDAPMEEPPPLEQSDLVIRRPDAPEQGGNTEDARREQMLTQLERDRLLDELMHAPEGTVDRNRTSPDGQLDLDIAVLAAGAPGDPEFQRWQAEVMRILMPLFRPLTQGRTDLTCLVNIQMDETTGAILGWEIVSPSGVRAFDAAAERAVQDAGSLPLPPEKYLPMLDGGVGFRFVAP
jgi:hypothetical protein